MRRLLPLYISIMSDRKLQERVPTEGFIPLISFERGHSLLISIRGGIGICHYVVASGLFHVVSIFHSQSIRVRFDLDIVRVVVFSP